MQKQKSICRQLLVAWFVLNSAACANEKLASADSVMSAPESGTGLQPLPTTPEPERLRPRWDQAVNRETADAWTEATRTAFEQFGQQAIDSNPSDISRYCPKYSEFSREQRLDFWVYFVSVIAQFESSFRPEVQFEESFNDADGRPVVSRGLLQISLGSSQGYRCGFRVEGELHDPIRNLECGVRILSQWIDRDQRVIGGSAAGARGAGRYWSIFRPSHARHDAVVRTLSLASTCR